jgi:hypothetical protein
MFIPEPKSHGVWFLLNICQGGCALFLGTDCNICGLTARYFLRWQYGFLLPGFLVSECQVKIHALPGLELGFVKTLLEIILGDVCLIYIGTPKIPDKCIPKETELKGWGKKVIYKKMGGLSYLLPTESQVQTNSIYGSYSRTERKKKEEQGKDNGEVNSVHMTVV